MFSIKTQLESDSTSRVVRFATVFEFLTGDEICVTVTKKA